MTTHAQAWLLISFPNSGGDGFPHVVFCWRGKETLLSVEEYFSRVSDALHFAPDICSYGTNPDVISEFPRDPFDPLPRLYAPRALGTVEYVDCYSLLVWCWRELDG